MSKSFREFLTFYKFSSSNNFLVDSDYIVYDALSPSFISYPLTPINLNFRKFFKYSLKKSLLKNLLSLFHFKYQKKTKIDFYKNDVHYQFINPYRERSRLLSYPFDDDFDFFLTITYRNPFRNGDFDVFKIASFNDYLNECVKRGFKRMRDYFLRHYKLELSKKMSLEALEDVFGYVPSSEDIKKYINEETKLFMSKNFKYFKVYELHKSNIIHAHILIKFPKFFTDLTFEDMISKLASWFETEKNGIELDRINKNKKGSGSVKSYILKYLNKQFQHDDLVFVENERKEKIYILKTSSFVLHFLNRLISKSRNVVVKKYRPFSEFSQDKINPTDGVHRDVSLLDFDVEKREFDEFKSIVDAFSTISEKRLRNHQKNCEDLKKAVYVLEQFLDGYYFSIEGVEKALDILRFNKDYYVLYYRSYKKFNDLLFELEKLDDDWVDF